MEQSGNEQKQDKQTGSLFRMFFDVRPEEAATVTRFSIDAVGVNIFNAILVVLCIWSDAKAQMLLSWLTVSIIIFLLVLRNTLRHSRNIQDSIHPNLVLEAVFFTVLIALPWPVLGYLVVGHGNQLDSVFVLLTCVGMSAGGAMVTYRIPLAALAYILTILVGATLTITLNAFSELWLLNIFMINCALMMVSTVINAWRIARKREEGLKTASIENRALQIANDEIRRLSLLDVLTGLYNRKAFVEKLENKIKVKDTHSLSILLLDLDRFKHINDSLGHDAGDELLQVVTKRLSNAVSGIDVIARFGGDEFALVIADSDIDVANKVSRRILSRLNEPVTIKGTTIHPNASIGVAFYPEHSGNPEELISLADIALHYAKEKGRGRFELYNREMARSIAHTDEVKAILSDAIGNKKLQVFYQPKFDLETENIIGAEALLRCNRPSGDMIPTDLLLEVAEECGFIPQITGFVFDQVASDVLAWKKTSEAIPVSINVHAFDLKAPDLLVSKLKEMFASGVERDDILLEVTQGGFVGRGADAAYATLDMIDEMGVKFSLDDFGTGHAALTHLKRFQVSEIKVDGEFVQGMCHDERDRAITVSILELSRNLGVSCVAEGIETLEQLNTLRKMKTPEQTILGQGFYWAPAMEADKFLKFVRSHKSNDQAAAERA